VSSSYRPSQDIARGMREVDKVSGFVGLIDVLGFREMIGRDEDLSQVRQYIDTVISLFVIGENARPQFVLFSDNLILYTLDDNKDSFLELIEACSHLAFELAQKRIPVRGAIAHGPFMRSPMARQGVILAGRPIVEADYYQHSQDWVGIMLAPSVVRRDDNLLQNTMVVCPEAGDTAEEWYKRAALGVHLQRWKSIPFHSNCRFDGYAVVPMRRGVHTPAQIVQSLQETLQQFERMRAAAPDPNSQQKYYEGLEWLRNQEQRWRDESRTTAFQALTV
jgi:hypothetical protein